MNIVSKTSNKIFQMTLIHMKVDVIDIYYAAYTTKYFNSNCISFNVIDQQKGKKINILLSFTTARVRLYRLYE